MAAETFFSRWSKEKSTTSSETDDLQQHAAAVSLPEAGDSDESIASPDGAVQPLPTLEDVEKLTHDSDYSAFMGQGVDESVKRSAMKKLFSNPHFNIMDGLDVYIDDYSKFEPISPALLASLNHAKALLNPLSQLQAPMMSLLEKIPQENTAALDKEPSVPMLDEALADGLPAEPVAETALSDAALEHDAAEQQNPQEREPWTDREQESGASEPDQKERSASSRVNDV